MAAVAEHLNHPEITLLVGPRQSGKTTILKRLVIYHTDVKASLSYKQLHAHHRQT